MKKIAIFTLTLGVLGLLFVVLFDDYKNDLSRLNLGMAPATWNAIAEEIADSQFDSYRALESTSFEDGSYRWLNVVSADLEDTIQISLNKIPVLDYEDLVDWPGDLSRGQIIGGRSPEFQGGEMKLIRIDYEVSVEALKRQEAIFPELFDSQDDAQLKWYWNSGDIINPLTGLPFLHRSLLTQGTEIDRAFKEFCVEKTGQSADSLTFSDSALYSAWTKELEAFYSKKGQFETSLELLSSLIANPIPLVAIEINGLRVSFGSELTITRKAHNYMAVLKNFIRHEQERYKAEDFINACQSSHVTLINTDEDYNFVITTPWNFWSWSGKGARFDSRIPIGMNYDIILTFNESSEKYVIRNVSQIWSSDIASGFPKTYYSGGLGVWKTLSYSPKSNIRITPVGKGRLDQVWVVPREVKLNDGSWLLYGDLDKWKSPIPKSDAELSELSAIEIRTDELIPSCGFLQEQDDSFFVHDLENYDGSFWSKVTVDEVLAVNTDACSSTIVVRLEAPISSAYPRNYVYKFRIDYDEQSIEAKQENEDITLTRWSRSVSLLNPQSTYFF